MAASVLGVFTYCQWIRYLDFFYFIFCDCNGWSEPFDGMVVWLVANVLWM